MRHMYWMYAKGITLLYDNAPSRIYPSIPLPSSKNSRAPGEHSKDTRPELPDSSRSPCSTP